MIIRYCVPYTFELYDLHIPYTLEGLYATMLTGDTMRGMWNLYTRKLTLPDGMRWTRVGLPMLTHGYSPGEWEILDEGPITRREGSRLQGVT